MHIDDVGDLDTDNRRRSVLDYSATNFLSGGWYDTQFMSPNIQDMEYDPSDPSAQFPKIDYEGWMLHPTDDRFSSIGPQANGCFNDLVYNYSGNQFETWQMQEVRRSSLLHCPEWKSSVSEF